MTRIWFFAPRGVPGGIATWAATWTAAASPLFEFRWVDTARRYEKAGSRTVARRALGGWYYTFKRHWEARDAIRSNELVYLNVSPNLGLWFRDFPLLWRLHRAGVPTIVHLHGGAVSAFFGGSTALRRVSAKTLSPVSALICITEEVADAARALVGAECVHIVPNMIDPYAVESYVARARRNRPVIVHVAGQSPAKGTLEVMRVAARTKSADFRMIGPVSASTAARVREVERELGVISNLEWLGELPHAAVQKQLAEADVLLFPSHNEGFPMVVLEAMRAGVPVLASDVGATRDMLTSPELPPAGIVLDLSDCMRIHPLVDHLKMILENEEHASFLGANGRARVRQLYSVKNVAARLDDIVRDAADRGFGAAK